MHKVYLLKSLGIHEVHLLVLCFNLTLTTYYSPQIPFLIIISNPCIGALTLMVLTYAFKDLSIRFL